MLPSFTGRARLASCQFSVIKLSTSVGLQTTRPYSSGLFSRKPGRISFLMKLFMHQLRGRPSPYEVKAIRSIPTGSTSPNTSLNQHHEDCTSKRIILYTLPGKSSSPTFQGRLTSPTTTTTQSSRRTRTLIPSAFLRTTRAGLCPTPTT